MSLQVARIKGIPIRLHFTLIVVFFLILWTLAARFMPQLYPNLSQIDYWIMGAVGALILFISILLHELAHSLVAVRYGLKVRQIILFIFGGVSYIEEEKEETIEDFRKEFKIAVVGPITSFIIASIFASVWWFLSQMSMAFGEGATVIQQMTVGVLFYGAIVNTLLGAFNLIPAFPLDGGRILRSALLRWKKDYDQATKIAVKIGIWISYGFMGFGFLSILGGAFIGGIWLIFIGWFLNSGAQSYLYQREITTALSGVRLRDIMNTRVISVTEGTILNELLRNYFNTYMKSAFPVLNPRGELLGMVNLKEVMDVPENKRHEAKVEEIMTPRSNLIILTPDRKADEALMQMTRRHMGKVFVCSGGERKLAGLVSKTDIMNVANERQEYVQASKRS
ncbi:MAG: site-2 protease family protein [Nitrososphaeraceae archaeon]